MKKLKDKFGISHL